MTRSEVLEVAIINALGRLFGLSHDREATDAQKEVQKLTLDLLLAEQKRSDGCAYCNGNMLDGYALENMYGESQRIINLAMKNHRSGDQLPISFCPNCGRSLTEGESV